MKSLFACLMAAALCTAGALPATAAAPTPPEAVVKQLYAIWLRPGRPPKLVDVKRQLSRRYYAELDHAYKAREIDVDPITGNQGNTLDATVYSARRADRAGAVVVPVRLHVGFSPPGHAEWLDLKVVRDHGEWRVDNVTEGATPAHGSH